MKRIVLLLLVTAVVIPASNAQRRKRDEAKAIQLPSAKTSSNVSLESALVARRSVRSFSDKNLSYEQLSQLSWAGQGITDKEKGYRTAPSAGAIFPMIIYFAIEEGLFEYEPQSHVLRQIVENDVRRELSRSAIRQPYIAEAPCSIIIAGNVKKVSSRYGKKARTYTILEAGHIAQNILLQAAALELGAVPVGAFDSGDVRRICRTQAGYEPFYIIPVGYPQRADLEPQEQQTQEPKEQTEVEEVSKEPVVDKQLKALVIIAREKFRDEEYFETIVALEDASIQTAVASSVAGTASSMLGARVEAAMNLKQVNADEFDAVIFIGGLGARQFFDDPDALAIARKAYEQKKLLAAICVAPTILANAGLLEGVKATSYPSQRARLTKAGAEYVDAAVQVDGRIITGSGPKASREFGQAIVESLKNPREN